MRSSEFFRYWQEEIHLNQLEDKKEELSTRSVDFSIRDTTWLDHAKLVSLFVFKTAAISYSAYYLGGSHIQRIGKFALQVLQNSNIPFLQGATTSRTKLNSKIFLMKKKSPAVNGAFKRFKNRRLVPLLLV